MRYIVEKNILYKIVDLYTGYTVGESYRKKEDAQIAAQELNRQFAEKSNKKRGN